MSAYPQPEPGSSARRPPLAELLSVAHVVSIPMRVRFRGIVTREALLLRGPVGWSEFSPFLEYEDAEASRWLAAAIEAGWHGWPTAVRETIPVNATVPALPASEVPALLERFPGVGTAKIKVAEPGQGPSDDIDRVAAVRAHLGSGARIRVDANGRWDVEQAVETLSRLARFDLEYAEQPAMAVEDLAAVRRGLARRGAEVRVAADESIRKAEDPLRVAELEAADVIVVKVAPLGGVRPALRIAEECGLPTVVSSALDTSVGIAGGLALAAALPELDFACGLGTVSLLAGDVAEPSLRPVNGTLPVGAVNASAELLERHAAPAERRRWWLDRLSRCHALLPEC